MNLLFNQRDIPQSIVIQTGAKTQWQIQQVSCATPRFLASAGGRGALVQAKNGRIKPNTLLYGGVERTVKPDNGVFQIRQYKNRKSIYTNCGTDVEQALARLAQLQAKASLLTAQRKLGTANERHSNSSPTS